ncbi:MAG: hypothetical protein KGJ23_13650 [Euryarchaeota archaeon]|nr:hypothetical protein [Euryarchaeota archaeon]MDE1837642.1 hypothetical protein [Euryarchaeota archaeon]MDE2045927.1 hypothetical protein [Thermoplasmata archaeon]
MNSGTGANSKPTFVELRSLSRAPKEFKVALLKELGYGCDGTHVLTPSGEKYLDPYSSFPVTISNMIILPGNSPPVILDDSPLSISRYIDEYGDIF